MNFLLGLLVLLIAYLFGSIPFGLIIVRFSTGRDIRKIESGRTGATNAMRAAGIFAGAATIIFDFLKGVSAVWLARLLIPEEFGWRVWIEVFAGLAAILGHNYSIFLAERNESGRWRLRGGAGGATAVGGATGLWLPGAFIIIPLALLILFGIGYASIATMSTMVFATIIFSYLAWTGVLPWEYIFYSLLAEIVLLIALRPNIIRLMNGTERLVGWRARRKMKK